MNKGFKELLKRIEENENLMICYDVLPRFGSFTHKYMGNWLYRLIFTKIEIGCKYIK